MVVRLRSGRSEGRAVWLCWLWEQFTIYRERKTEMFLGRYLGCRGYVGFRERFDTGYLQDSLKCIYSSYSLIYINISSSRIVFIYLYVICNMRLLIYVLIYY